MIKYLPLIIESVLLVIMLVFAVVYIYKLNKITKKPIQEEKMGHWIGGDIGRCSYCGHKGCASDIWNDCENIYCPNCGAKLK